MRVNTASLFERLLPLFDAGIVCDVGSMDGTEALRFARRLPHASVFAFEPNPWNLAPMRANLDLQRARVEIVPCAVADRETRSPFHVLRADYANTGPQRGRSSLYPAVVASELLEVIEVPTVRLDAFLATRTAPQARIALWIDAEGMAYETLAGASALAARLQLVHVEVERVPCMNAAQKLYPDVRRLLATFGLREIASDGDSRHRQFNALFVRDELTLSLRLRIAAWTAIESLSFLFHGALRRLRIAARPN
ncbi:MAG TPA: FkbM family methyltransferase [Steroidobacteraceae bacterium]